MSRYTVADIDRVLDRYKKSNRKNPRDGASCVYTGSNGKHCIVGQVITDLGHEDVLPGFGSRDNCTGIRTLGIRRYERIRELFDGEAWNYLRQLQGNADRLHPWWKVISRTRRMRKELGGV